MNVSVAELIPLIDAANTARWEGHAPGGGDAGSVEAEQALEARFRIHQTLAVYGTLAPGPAEPPRCLAAGR